MIEWKSTAKDSIHWNVIVSSDVIDGKQIFLRDQFIFYYYILLADPANVVLQCNAIQDLFLKKSQNLINLL